MVRPLALSFRPLALSIVAVAAGVSCPAAAADEVVLGTFNCEFLLPAKVHMKYRLPFELDAEDERTWNRPGHREQHYADAVQAVAKFLATLEADILVLTEVGNRQEVEPLVTALSDHGQA